MTYLISDGEKKQMCAVVDCAPIQITCKNVIYEKGQCCPTCGENFFC